MIKRKQLGQHFLNSNSIAQFIVSEAKITKKDTVFEIGTGLGILTPLLCQNANKVISVDVDEKLVNKAKSKFSSAIFNSPLNILFLILPFIAILE